jgi:PAS domain S-box-containing protein
MTLEQERPGGEGERLLAREQAARLEAEHATEILRLLEEVTKAALAHLAHGDLLDELLRQITRIVDADTSAILLLDDEARFLTVRATLGFDREIEHARPIPFGQGMAGRVAASGKPVLIDDLAGIELASPHLRLRGIASLVAIPIAVDDRVIGVAHAGSVRKGHFTQEHLNLLTLLADRIALAVTQAGLYEREREARREAERARGRLSFLAEASTILASSLDYESTLDAVTRMVVPHLADWCDLDVVGPHGELVRLASAHADPSRTAELQAAFELRPPEADDPVGPYAVLRTGTSELVPHVEDELLTGFAGSADRAEALRRIGFASYMCVPMLGRDGVLGTITFVSGDPERRFAEPDLALAEELARRAALAVENALLFRRAEERAQAARVLEAVGDGVFLLDADGIVRLWNPAAEAITGLPAAVVVGRTAAAAIPGWRELGPRVPVVSEHSRAAARAVTVPLELAGSERWLSVSGVGFADGTVYAFRDLTQDRQLDELKSEFVATVSHELRTPLAAIYGAAMTLRRSDLADLADREELVEVVVRESERLASIVDDILWASGLDSGAMQVSIQHCDAEELARSVIEAVETHRPRNLELVLVAESGLPPVAGDPDKIRQVLANLVDNAVKYSPDGGRTTVQLAAGEATLRFSVTDEGLGVPPSEQRRIFEKFYRLDPNLTRGVGGTGLGLYICRELVRRMNGRIWVVSPRPGGRGSTFAFELPLAVRE